MRACQAGHRVLFATAAEWVARLAEAHQAGRIHAELTRLGRYPLIVVHEVGYIPFEPEAANLFFHADCRPRLLHLRRPSVAIRCGLTGCSSAASRAHAGDISPGCCECGAVTYGPRCLNGAACSTGPCGSLAIPPRPWDPVEEVWNRQVVHYPTPGNYL
jgi:hypothetical protein